MLITGGSSSMTGYEHQGVFTNGGGTVTTDPSALTVGAPPTIVNPLMPMTTRSTSVGPKVLASDPAFGTDAG